MNINVRFRENFLYKFNAVAHERYIHLSNLGRAGVATCKGIVLSFLFLGKLITHFCYKFAERIVGFQNMSTFYLG